MAARGQRARVSIVFFQEKMYYLPTLTVGVFIMWGKFFFVLVLFPLSLYAAQVKAEEGKETYEHFCITCHQDGIAGAPKFRNKKEWDARLSGKKIEDLVDSAVNGLNTMPPQGTCTECSEEDILAAVTYMMPKP